jgi:NAD(P)-dependent dehydrogenase (short-subunit alcohol dehydrogenase family)
MVFACGPRQGGMAMIGYAMPGTSPTPSAAGEEKRTLILTGASRGIGHATVKRFSSAGWRVITCSRHAFPEDCPWAAGPEDHIQVDLADPDDTLRAVAEMRERLNADEGGGRLHALVNNAAISPKGPAGADGHAARLGVLESPMALWRQVFEVNLFSTIWLAQGLKAELAAAHGAIVNVTSIAGSRVHPFAGAAYATSKAALAALTREMAADFGPWHVRVNAIAPGEIDTAILSPGTEKIVEHIPLRRLGTPAEVAKAIYYLCTDQSSYVTGAELMINGGQHV